MPQYLSAVWREWSRVRTWVVVGILALLMVHLTHRASTHSISHDEALTWMRWVSGGWTSIFDDYTANNHILYTIAAKAASDLLGHSPFVLRLPALLSYGAIAWLLAAHVRRAPAAALCLFPVLALATNPMLLDLACCGRGYAPAVACLIGALVSAVGTLRRADGAGVPRWPLARTGLLAGTAIAFNLVAASAGVAICLWLAGGWVLRRRVHRRPLLQWQMVSWLSLPAALVLLPTVGPVLPSIEPRMLYFGAAGLEQSWSEVIGLWSTHTRTTLYEPPGYRETGLWDHLLVAGALLALTVGSLHLALRRRAEAGEGRLLCIGCAFALWTSIAVAWGQWHMGGLPTPMDRTALPWIALLHLGLLGLSGEGNGGWRIGSAALTALLLVGNLRHIPADHYAEWHHDKNSHTVFRALKEHRRDDRPLRVFCHPQHYWASIEYYRITEGATWLAPVDRDLRVGTKYDLAIVLESVATDPQLGRYLGPAVYRNPEVHLLITRFDGLR